MASESAVRDLYRGYDIRGLAGIDLTEDVATAMGLAFAAYLRRESADTVYLGLDGRPSGAALTEALARGLVDGGARVVDLGVVPTPLVYFASSRDPGSHGAAVTASHLAAAWNGLKFCRGSLPIHTDVVREILEAGAPAAPGGGSRRPGRRDVLEAYGAMLAEVAAGSPGQRASTSPLGVVVDCQNAAASAIAPAAFESLGLEVHPMFTDASAGYPFETPDPQIAGHLEPLREEVARCGAAAGFAFDGDADRLGVVDERGRRLSPDIVLALLAEDVLVRHPGAAVVYDVLASPVVEEVVRRAGGRPIEARSGHAFVQDLLREEGAPIGGEGSGHIFFADGYRGHTLGYDDAIYAGVRLVEYIRRRGPLGALADALPAVVAGDEWRPRCPDGLKRRIVEDVETAFREAGYRVSAIDGVKAHFGPLAWALVRAANTEPCLSVRCVGPTVEEVGRMEEETAKTVRRLAARYDVSL